MVFPDDISPAALEHDPSVIFVLDSSLRIAYCNTAWDRFAAANGGNDLLRPAPIGRSLVDSIGEPLSAFYESAYQGVLHSLEPWRHFYECSSPATFRKFSMHVLPLRSTGGLLVVNSLCVERPHGLGAGPPSEAAYRQADGLIVMCSHCRRTRRTEAVGRDAVGRDAIEQWDWVAEYVAEMPPRTSHGLCKVCLEYYYPRGG